jgi:cytochrome c peroxidase
MIKWLSCIFIVFFGLVSFVGHLPKKPTPMPFVYPKNWPKPLYNFKENPLTYEGFELGKTLFYDTRLSKDSSISCNSCHQQFAAFSTYDHPLSHGIGDSLSKRNAPALQNLAWKPLFNADGGIHHLEVQPLAPITAPNEMGETIENVLKKLNRDKKMQQMHFAAFGSKNFTTATLNKALSQFVVQLITSNSKYDLVQQGKANYILPEQLGHDIFMKKCVQCHVPPFFTDFSFRNVGLPKDKFLNDDGRMGITTFSDDSLKFMVPSLRNVMVTAPYTHDGRFFGVQAMMEHYRKQVKATRQTDSLVRNFIPLSNFEIGQLTGFLYTLTDTSFLKNKNFAPKDYPIIPNFIHLH